MIWIQFILSSGVIIFAGIKLTKSADTLSERCNLGKVWVGVLLLGLVTSLPEAVASITSVVRLEAYDLAIGNVLGSNCFNPILIVVLDIAYRQGSITDRIGFNQAHFIPAVFAVLATLFVITEISLSTFFGIPRFGFYSIACIVIVILYLVCMRILAKLHSQGKEEDLVQTEDNAGLKNIYVSLIVSSALVVVGAVWLANTADTIAFQTGLGRTFVGSIFLAAVTSLPEIVVTLSALKLNEFDLAMGNIFGSNMTNLFIISLSDIFTKGGHILSQVSFSHIVTATVSILLTGIIFLGVRCNNKKRFLGLGWDSWVLTGVFVTGMRILYQLR